MLRGAHRHTNCVHRRYNVTTEHKEPHRGKESDDIFVVAVESGNAQEEG